jgi:hypothetical protein
MANMVLTAFMLCMMMKVVSDVGSGTLVIQDPYCFAELVSEPPDEEGSWLVVILSCRVE